jgi:hypothetical protein
MKKSYFSKDVDEKIPEGFAIFLKNSFITGIQYRREDVIKFIHSGEIGLALEQEPDNPEDKNAIKIIGKSGADKYFLGYLSRDYSKQINDSGLFEKIFPRLLRVYHGKDDFVDITFQIIGPKSLKEDFNLYKVLHAPSEVQLEFLKFLNVEIPDDSSMETLQELISNLPNSGISLFNKYDALVEEACEQAEVDRSKIISFINKLILEGIDFELMLNNPSDVFFERLDEDF